MPDARILPQINRAFPPGPPGYPLVGVLPRLRNDPLGYLTDISHRYGEIVNLGARRWGLRWFLISGPDQIQYILQENHRNYRHGLNSAILTKHLAGNGLPVNDGPTWLRQRRLIQPAFHHDRIAAENLHAGDGLVLGHTGEGEDRSRREDQSEDEHDIPSPLAQDENVILHAALHLVVALPGGTVAAVARAVVGVGIGFARSLGFLGFRYCVHVAQIRRVFRARGRHRP